jgi:two-component system, NarL family, response regulator YdfI
MADLRGPIRVVVVDDHEVVREGLRMMLDVAGKGEFTVVGEAADGASALLVLGETEPDVVLMDLRMPGVDGLEAIARIRAQWHHISVIILTTYDEDDLLFRGIDAGACGFLLKDTDRATVFHAIRTAARGDAMLQPDMLARLLAYTASGAGHRNEPASAAFGQKAALTAREREILAGVAEGERNKEIAARLGITTRTVVTHLTNIYGKLEVDSRAAAVAVALQRGILR